MDYCHRKLTLLASKAIREGVTTRDQHNLTGKAVVSSIEVQESQIYAAFVGFIVQTVAEEAFIHLNPSVTSFFSLGEGVADAECCIGV